MILRTVTFILIGAAVFISEPAIAQSIIGTPHFLKAKKEAADRDVNLLVHFTASWSNPCSKIFGTTYRDPQVRQILQEQMVFTLVDIDDFDGYVLAQHYNIQNLPTLVLFEPDGRILRLQRGYLNKEELLEFLDLEAEFDQGKEIAQKREEEPGMMERINGGPSGETDDSLTGAQLTEKPKKHEAGNESSASPTAPLGEFYSIQLGAFSARGNAEKLIHGADPSIRNQLLVFPEEASSGKRYLLLGGQFDSRVEAEKFLTRVKSHGMNGFIKKIDNSANS